MISRISSIISSHATAIPSDEGRVYSLVPRVAMPVQRVELQKETYADFAKDRRTKFAESVAMPKKQDKAQNSSLYGYRVALYASNRLIIRA